MSKKKSTVPSSVSMLKAVDFFCGAGGVTQGFRMAGIKVIAGIDIDISCKETYEKNNTGSKFIHADISKLKPLDLEKKINIKANTDDLIFIGCSPCQYYTIINTNKEQSKKGKLLLEEFRKFVDYFNPGYIFIENVPGIEKKDDTPLAAFKEFIKTKGYSCDDDVINASGYNVPQNRRRYVLIASRVTEKIEIPKPSKKKITVREVIKNFPPIPAGFKNKSHLKHWSSNLQGINKKRLQNTPHNGGTRLAWKDNDELQLTCYKNKDDMFVDVYGRMFWDLPSPTITTKFFSLSNGRFGHPVQNRGISLREGASLQSFPKSYKFYSDSIATVARMIGNAVPPQMAKKIGTSLIKNYYATIQS